MFFIKHFTNVKNFEWIEKPVVVSISSCEHHEMMRVVASKTVPCCAWSSSNVKSIIGTFILNLKCSEQMLAW